MSDTQSTTTDNRRGMSPETARQILAQGKMQSGGKTVYVITNMLSELPPVKNESLVDRDFVIHSLSGEVTTEYGEAWIFEVGPTIAEATRSWLVGKPLGRPNDSIVGKNLKRHFDKNGADAFPIFAHLTYHDEGRGNAYYSLEAPRSILERADSANSAPALPATQQPPANFQAQAQQEVAQVRAEVSTLSQNELDDLPF